ncbi:MAG: SDR family oxidoreductase [Balneolaceae bacterium]
MDLTIEGQRFLVCGASSGLGNATAHALLREGASLLVTARRADLLEKEFSLYGERVVAIAGDIREEKLLKKIACRALDEPLHGMMLNAGGPPVGTPLETKMEDWDRAWELVMRWKIELTLAIAPALAKRGYGRILYLESKTVKQPLPALVLSNAFRAGVTGFAKSLSREVGSRGVTVNVLAPGSHETPAIERVIRKQSEQEGISAEEAKAKMEKAIPVGRMGRAEEFGQLAAWLLSPLSGYITGQTISHDGGDVAGLFG